MPGEPSASRVRSTYGLRVRTDGACDRSPDQPVRDQQGDEEAALLKPDRFMIAPASSSGHGIASTVHECAGKEMSPGGEPHLLAGAFVMPRDRAYELVTPTATLMKRARAVSTIDRARVQTPYRRIWVFRSRLRDSNP